MTDKIVILCTCASEAQADQLARTLVDERLAACVNVLPPIRSIYRWKDAVESAEEWLLLIKSSRQLFPQIRSTVERLHTYEVPELIAMSIVDGAPAYLAWLGGNLKEGSEA